VIDRGRYCFGLSSKCKIGSLGRIVVGRKLPILSFIVWTLFVLAGIFVSANVGVVRKSAENLDFWQ
jgi:hypothetical protein